MRDKLKTVGGTCFAEEARHMKLHGAHGATEVHRNVLVRVSRKQTSKHVLLPRREFERRAILVHCLSRLLRLPPGLHDATPQNCPIHFCIDDSHLDHALARRHTLTRPLGTTLHKSVAPIASMQPIAAHTPSWRSSLEGYRFQMSSRCGCAGWRKSPPRRRGCTQEPHSHRERKQRWHQARGLQQGLDRYGQCN
jgi:hypothetical protein